MPAKAIAILMPTALPAIARRMSEQNIHNTQQWMCVRRNQNLSLSLNQKAVTHRLCGIGVIVRLIVNVMPAKAIAILTLTALPAIAQKM
jgi:hypothetical protein